MGILLLTSYCSERQIKKGGVCNVSPSPSPKKKQNYKLLLIILNFEKELVETFNNLFDQYDAIKFLLQKIFESFKKSNSANLNGVLPREDMTLKKIFDVINELRLDFSFEVYILTFDASFDLKKMKNFLETAANDIEKISVNIFLFGFLFNTRLTFFRFIL